MNKKHLFGPVNSRRLGISLGVDMVQFKVCSLNCVYCECGETTQLTSERKEYSSKKEIISELTEYLSENPRLDYVTFAGSGEPTLNTGIGEIVCYVKQKFPQYKTALLTNGTLFNIAQVREEVMPFDLICPSLDAVSDDVFSKVNRPDDALKNSEIINGLTEFAKEYKGQLWVEVFIVPGVNDNPGELSLFKEALQKIKPTRVQLNSLDRPGTCEWVRPAEISKLHEIARFLSPLPVEIISRQIGKIHELDPVEEGSEEAVICLLARRPSTVEELSSLTGRTINQINLLLDKLIDDRRVVKELTGSNWFYRIYQD
jgi:wyosine [tRNA(Phe)-imidazoG37] synthetase (radical SAM superfamily)